MRSKERLGPSAANGAEIPRQYWRFTLQAALQAAVLIALLTVVLLWNTDAGLVPLAIGEAAMEDILAPAHVTYVSELATEAERDRAEAAVADVYTQPDPEVIATQLDFAADVLDYMDTVRHDPYASLDERIARVQEIPNLNISESVLRTALSFSDLEWADTVTKTLWAAEQIMTQGIRENQLLEARARLSLLLSSEIISAEQEKVIVGLARSFIVPTSEYDDEATQIAREQARQQVQPVERTIKRNQAILFAGAIVTEEDLEELAAIGLARNQRSPRQIAGTAVFAALLVVIPGAFIQQMRPGYWAHWRRVILISLAMVLTLVLAKFMIPGHVLLPYLFPMAAISMLLTLLLEDVALAEILTAMLSLAVGFVGDGSVELTVLYLASGTIGSLAILHREKLSAFIRAGAFVAVTNMTVALGFQLLAPNGDIAAITQVVLAGLLNGVLSASVTFATFSWIGRLFGITNALQLLELARPTQPLLKQMALKAPGTYHHTLIVSNMAERAAEAIGANSLIARIGGYYHDIGKSVRPYFFIENSTPEENIHQRLDPRTSAQIIISHVTDGLDLAKQYSLPKEIQDIILQHHGTTVVGYFYQLACRRARENEDVDEADFQYPGPKPQTKEAAIVMLADVEAAVRSSRPSTVDEMDRMVRQFINLRLISGELDECDITLRDLDLIRESFVGVLKGVFHPRIQYPSGQREGTPPNGNGSAPDGNR